MPEEAPEELNATDLLEVDAELSTNGEKPSEAEIIAEIQGEVPDNDEGETDIDFVIDDPKLPLTEIEIEKAVEALEELSIAMLKRKKQKTIENYFRN